VSNLPKFAVVGHPNKGKSSIVATLAEDDTVAISRDPGTTTRARTFPMRVDGKAIYELIDTPGFQRAREVLAWLHAHDRGAEARPALLREFVDTHRTDARFRDECELLSPMIAGAGILYVVDGAHPYGREYEAEMEVLRWTGQPRMALINLIGQGNHVAEWRRALDQYFAIVRVFDAVHADFDKRIDLLRAFGELHEPWAPALKHAADVLRAERSRRRRRAATEIADLLCESLTLTRKAGIEGDEIDPALSARLTDELKEAVRHRERRARRIVQEIYQHAHVHLEESGADVLTDDVFSERTFSLFGLSGTQLALTGAASGAVAGGGLDLIAGGASLGLAAAIGALIGGAGALFGADQLAKVKVLGAPLGGSQLRVGPIADPNFPWVLLGRAMLHHRLVAERNHARREKLVLDAAAGAHLTDDIDSGRRRRLERCFVALRKERELDADTRRALIREIEALLEDPKATA
jgi:hypothetical protein